MKLRLFARRLGVSAPKMTVQRHVSLPLRMASIALAVAVGAVGAIWAWQTLFGNAKEEKQQLSEQLTIAKSELAKEKAERERLTEIANKADAQIKIEKAASEQLAKQMKSLEADNGKLLADAAYLETLLPSDGAAGNIAIRRLSLEKETSANTANPQQIRYKALVMQGGREQKEFAGAIQIVATGTLNGKPLSITLPDQGSPEVKERMKIAFKRYQRVEGFIEVPAGAVIKTVQLRLLEKGTLRAQETASL
jgi:cell division protein FtsL